MSKIKAQLTTESISAGFPSPAESYMETPLDLNEYLVTDPPATFFIKAMGDSMIGAGIFSGDTVIVNRALNAKNGSIIVAHLEGEFTLKRLRISQKVMELIPENSQFESIEIREDSDFEVWGVVTHTIHSF